MVRCEGRRMSVGWRLKVAPAVDNACPQCADECQDRRRAPLEAARRADAEEGPHEQAHVAGTRLDEQAFEDVAVPAQICAAHRPGLIKMGVRSLEMPAPPPQEDQPARATDAPAIRIDRVARRGVLRPAAPAAGRFRDVGPQVEGRQIDEHLITVVPLATPRILMGASPIGLSRAPERSRRHRQLALLARQHSPVIIVTIGLVPVNSDRDDVEPAEGPIAVQSAPHQKARTFAPCARNWPCGPTYL